MGQPIAPSIKKISDIKHQLLQPALTSHYVCSIEFPPNNNNSNFDKILSDNGFTRGVRELLSISCSEANLPGSSLATHELNNDFTGFTQKHAYRRLYDDRADFTFYVDQNYSQIRIFEMWIRYIVGEQIAFGEGNNISVRANYPKNYKAPAIYITKFERSYKPNDVKLEYSFINAFPIAVNSIPVSYDASSLLKTTVSFAYDRYIVKNVGTTSEGESKLISPSAAKLSPGTITDTPGRTVTNEYYNNFGDNRQNSTNFADFTDGSNAGPFGQAVG